MVLRTWGLMGRAAKPDLRTGLMKTVQVWYCTQVDSLHLKEKMLPRNPKRVSLAELIFLSTFLKGTQR